ncbi:ATP-binding cassette domain-containing protein [Halobaculum sp. MBLA0143]|uniref:ATP-binding cassette domain-containing protein n=1 Tax=Halobaculum sp. MBLA0143 TaxID=3079933 RepID=UPI003525F0EE
MSGGRLRTEALGKQYGDTWAVEDVTLDLDEGIHGLLGPNGAGKSTLLRTLTTLTRPTTGTAYWDGTDLTERPDAVRSVLGYLPQSFGAYPELTVAEFLEYVATLRGLDDETASARIEAQLELTNLGDVRHERIGTFSGGMRRRVGIAQALVNDPELLIVDEPTVGLDPEERVRFRNVLSSTADDRVVILSTHIVPDVEATANTVALMNDGRLVTHTDPETLAERVADDVYEAVVPRGELDTLRERHQVCRTVQRADGVEVRLLADDRPTETAERVTPTLEDGYLASIDGREGL